LHGTTVFGAFLSVAGVRAQNIFNFFCKTMSIAHLIDQRKMIFGKKLVNRNKAVCSRPWHILKEISAMLYALNMVCARTMELTR